MKTYFAIYDRDGDSVADDNGKTLWLDEETAVQRIEHLLNTDSSYPPFTLCKVTPIRSATLSVKVSTAPYK